MSQLIIFAALAIFVAILMRKKRHRPNKSFMPRAIIRSFSQNPTTKRNLRERMKNEKTITNIINNIGVNLHS